MTSDTTLDTNKLAELIGLLSCNELDPHETRHIVDLCLEAQAQPAATLATHYGKEAAQVAQYDPRGVTAFIIFVELEDYFAVADNVDEIHEQIIDAFEKPALPAYPYDDADFETLSEYYQWLDAQLMEHHPKYCLIDFGQSYTHEFQVILVYRDKLAEILSLCQDLHIEAQRCA